MDHIPAAGAPLFLTEQVQINCVSEKKGKGNNYTSEMLCYSFRMFDRRMNGTLQAETKSTALGIINPHLQPLFILTYFFIIFILNVYLILIKGTVSNAICPSF